jgi:D-glycero-D-manno-heptose 1,7-bisphosphate phosphatase
LRRALFLDRDGVINVDHGYVHRSEDFEFLPGIFELVRAARRRGLLPVVVTNQAGIARGYYDEAQFERLTAWMMARFATEGAALERVYHCPTHPTEGIGKYRVDSIDRKPGPGMLLRARDELGLDLGTSFMLGDKASDMLAGQAAGVGRLLLLHAMPDASGALPPGTRRVATLAEAQAAIEAIESDG